MTRTKRILRQARLDHPVHRDSRRLFDARTVLRRSGGVFGKGGVGGVGRLCPGAGRLYCMIRTEPEPPQNPSWWWRMGHLLDRVLDVVSVVPLLGWLIRIIVGEAKKAAGAYAAGAVLPLATSWGFSLASRICPPENESYEGELAGTAARIGDRLTYSCGNPDPSGPMQVVGPICNVRDLCIGHRGVYFCRALDIDDEHTVPLRSTRSWLLRSRHAPHDIAELLPCLLRRLDERVRGRPEPTFIVEGRLRAHPER